MSYTNFISFYKVFRTARFSVILKGHFDPSSRINRCTYSSNAFCILHVCLSLAHLLSNYSNIPIFKYSIVTYVHLARIPFSSSVHKTRNVITLPDKHNTAARNNCTTHVIQTLR